MTGMRGIARRTRKTRLQRPYPFLTKHSRIFQGLARTHFSFFKDSNQRLESTCFLVLRQHDCNYFNLHFEGLSAFASFRHLRIRVG